MSNSLDTPSFPKVDPRRDNEPSIGYIPFAQDQMHKAMELVTGETEVEAMSDDTVLDPYDGWKKMGGPGVCLQICYTPAVNGSSQSSKRVCGVLVFETDPNVPYDLRAEKAFS